VSRNLIICIKFDYQKTRYVLSHDELPEAPLPFPGQKGDIYTFRVLKCPRGIEPNKVSKLLVDEFLRINSRPNTGPEPWRIAYNIPYQVLLKHGVVTEAPNVSFDEMMEQANRAKYTIDKAIAKGKLACSRPPKPQGGTPERVVNSLDFEYYLVDLTPNYKAGATNASAAELTDSQNEE
jgi:hypothetical protein